jgi:hypothetical protein
MGMDRLDLLFDSAGEACAAWLYLPVTDQAAALVFDHRGFGDSAGEPDLFEPARQLDDWRAAIAFARSLPALTPTGWRPSDPRSAGGTRSPPRPRTGTCGL